MWSPDPLWFKCVFIYEGFILFNALYSVIESSSKTAGKTCYTVLFIHNSSYLRRNLVDWRRFSVNPVIKPKPLFDVLRLLWSSTRRGSESLCFRGQGHSTPPQHSSVVGGRRFRWRKKKKKQSLLSCIQILLFSSFAFERPDVLFPQCNILWIILKDFKHNLACCIFLCHMLFYKFSWSWRCRT